MKSRIWIPELVRDVEQHLIVDLELGRDGRFHGMAAKRGPTERVWESGTPFQRAHAELLDWMGDSRVLVGHNLHRFDAAEIAKRAPDSPLLSLPAVDTLELSVLAFPRRPYHRLTKDDDLVRDAKPRPLSDVRACATVLSDALEALEALDDDEAWLLAALLSWTSPRGSSNRCATDSRRGSDSSSTARGSRIRRSALGRSSTWQAAFRGSSR